VIHPPTARNRPGAASRGRKSAPESRKTRAETLKRGPSATTRQHIPQKPQKTSPHLGKNILTFIKNVL